MYCSNQFIKKNYKSMRASSYDVTGANNDSVPVPAGESKEIFLEGSGIIKHIWTTFLHENSKDYNSLQIKFEFDGEVTVDMPLAEFFALPDGNIHDLDSAPIQVSKTHNHPLKDTFESVPYRGAMNCYWEMPFLTSCKITLTNCDVVDYSWYYHVDWELHKTLPKDILYFHATKASQKTETVGEFIGHGETDFNEVHVGDVDNYVFCNIHGYMGHYMGLSLMIVAELNCNGSWWEGDEMLCIDGEAWPPRIHGTGLEDYFGLAYGFRVKDCRPQYGISHIEKNSQDPKQIAGKCCMYRFHLDTPIAFEKSFKGSLEHGHANITDAYYSSVAYWYGRKI